MAWIESRRTAEQALPRALVAGFAHVLTLLSLSSWVAVRGTSAIEKDAAAVDREQIAIARLLNDAEEHHGRRTASPAPGQQEPADRARVIRSRKRG